MQNKVNSRMENVIRQLYGEKKKKKEFMVLVAHFFTYKC